MKNHNRLGREIILWNNHEMVLWGKLCRHINARIFKRNPSPIQSLKPPKTTASAISSPKSFIWCRSPKMKPIDTSPELSTEQVKKIERMLEKLLYYARGVDNTFLVSLSKRSTRIDPVVQDEKIQTNLLITWQLIQLQSSFFTLQTLFYASTTMRNT